MRFCAMAFSRVVLTCSWLTTSSKDCGRYLRAITWYMGRAYARPRVIRGTRTAPLPLLPSGPGGVCSRPLHGARDLTSIYRSMGGRSLVLNRSLTVTARLRQREKHVDLRRHFYRISVQQSGLIDPLLDGFERGR